MQAACLGEFKGKKIERENNKESSIQKYSSQLKGNKRKFVPEPKFKRSWAEIQCSNVEAVSWSFTVTGQRT